MNQALVQKAEALIASKAYQKDVNTLKVLKTLSEMKIGYQSDFSTYNGHYILKAFNQHIKFDILIDNVVNNYRPFLDELLLDDEFKKAGISEVEKLHQQIKREVVPDFTNTVNTSLNISNSRLRVVNPYIALEKNKQDFVEKFDSYYNDLTRNLKQNILKLDTIQYKTVANFLDAHLDAIEKCKRFIDFLEILSPNDNRLNNLRDDLEQMQNTWNEIIERTSSAIVEKGDYDTVLKVFEIKEKPEGYQTIVQLIKNEFPEKGYVDTIFKNQGSNNYKERINKQGEYEKYIALSFTVFFEIDNKLEFHKGWYESLENGTQRKIHFTASVTILKPKTKQEKENAIISSKQEKLDKSQEEKEVFVAKRDKQVLDAQKAAQAQADKAIADAKKMMEEMQKKYGL